MILKTWDFEKDRTSTKIPTTDGLQYDVKLKENTSVKNPTFILNLKNTPVFTYCQYMFWFYYVEDIIFITKDIYEVKCKLDVLASYRNDIINSTQFVVRSASSYDVYLPDNEVKPTLNQTEVHFDTPMTFLQGSTFVVRVMGNLEDNVSSNYGINTFAMTTSQIRDLIHDAFDNAIFSTTTWSLDDIANLLKCIFFDPQTYIIGINWLPVNAETDGGNHRVYLGWYGTSVYAPMILADGTYYIQDMPIPQKIFGDFRDYDNNYTQFTLSLPCVGTINVNPDDAYAGLSVIVSIEYLTGTLIYNLYRRDTDAVINKYKTNVNCSIQIGGITHGINTGSITSLLTSAASEAVPTSPEYKIIGNIGSQIEISRDQVLRLNRRTFGSTQSPLLNKGKPLNEYRQLNTLQGYCECRNAILVTDAYGDVKNEILNHMNNGFIIE